MTYDTFDEWFLELESFSLRSERFLEVLDQGAPYNDMTRWLRAAFDAGREGLDLESSNSKTGVGKTGDGDSESRIRKLAEIANVYTEYEYEKSEEYWGDLYDRNFARMVAADCARIAYNKSGWCGAADIKKEYGVE
jgi:hypothetical protein